MVSLAIQERDLIQDVLAGKQSPATLEELLSTFRPANGFGSFRLTYQAAIEDVCSAGLEATLLPKLEALFDAHNLLLDEAKQPVPAGALEQHCLAIDALIDIANSAGKHLEERGAVHSDDVVELIHEEGSSAGNKTADEQPEPKNKNVERAKWLGQALLHVRDHPDWSDAKIAREVGKHPSTLSRDKTYQAAAAMARGDKSDWQRGFIKVDPDSGQQDVEAVTRDDNESMEVDHDQPKPGDPVAGAYPSAKTYARDEWIYKNIHLNSYDTLSVKLNKKAKTEKWAIISSRNGLKDAADRHADYHKKEKRRFKKH